MRGECGGRARGFTLLEVLVALAILGIVLVTVYRVAGNSVRALESREDRLDLAILAEAALQSAKLEGASSAADLSLTLPLGVKVRLERRAIDGSELSDTPNLPQELLDEISLLSVEVEDRHGRRFDLSTLVPSSEP